MSNYITHYHKKHDVLARKELRLTRMLQKACDPLRIRKAADEVRLARIRVQQAELAQLPANDNPPSPRRVKCLEKLENARATTVDDILLEFETSRAASRKETRRDA